MTMTVEERARDVVTQLCGPRAAENWVNRDVVINHIRAAEQEAAVQARSEADVKWANELGKLLADGEQVAEQRGAERALLECAEHVQEWSDQPAFQMLADKIRARAKQAEPA